MTVDKKLEIQQAINQFSQKNLFDSSINLFTVLGYKTDRQLKLEKPNYDCFKEQFIDDDNKFNEQKALITEWKERYIELLFQLSKDEITDQISLFDTKQVNNSIIESYLFFAIELKDNKYTRTQFAQITREINKLFLMPVMLLFKHGDSLTISVINRRLSKKDASKDVLEKVTLIKDINISNPHRAHIEILFDLTIDELYKKHQFTNFVELHNSWRKTLDISELNKRFYRELANWYFWAVQNVIFPYNEKDPNNNEKSVIRLITRLIFVWFLKEKGLIL